MGAFLLFYFFHRPGVLSSGLWWGSLILYLLFMYRAVQELGQTSFRNGVRAAFLVFVIANAMFYVFYYLLFGVFDPVLVDLQREMLTDSPFWQGGDTDMDLTVTIGRTLFSFAYSLIGGFILALAITGIARQ